MKRAAGKTSEEKNVEKGEEVPKRKRKQKERVASEGGKEEPTGEKQKPPKTAKVEEAPPPREEPKAVERVPPGSRNKWEQVEFTDGSDKSKFLRLMGCGKKKGAAAASAPDSAPSTPVPSAPSAPAPQSEELSKRKKMFGTMERQFREGVQRRGGGGSTAGLGFRS